MISPISIDIFPDVTAVRSDSDIYKRFIPDQFNIPRRALGNAPADGNIIDLGIISDDYVKTAVDHYSEGVHRYRALQVAPDNFVLN